jgi:flagellar motor switch protein FliG
MGPNTNITNAFDLGNIDLDAISVPKLSGAKKVAVLLLTLGTETASEIVKKLPDFQVQRIGVEIANLNTISASEREMILKEFVGLYKTQDYLIEGGIEYTKDLLNESFGEQQGQKMLEEIKYSTYNNSFASARKASASQLLSCIKDESPQTIALILSHIQSEKAGKILRELPADIRLTVALKIGTISTISNELKRNIDMALEESLNSAAKSDSNKISGLESLIDILENVDRTTEKDILGFIEEHDKLLSEQIKANMFVFEDIVKIDDHGIQKLLKEVNLRDIACAIKEASEEIQDVIFRNQSTRAQQSLREEIEMLGNIKKQKIEEAQQKVVSTIKRLESEGQIEINKGDED